MMIVVGVVGYLMGMMTMALCASARKGDEMLREVHARECDGSCECR